MLASLAMLALGSRLAAVFTAVPRLRGFHPGWYALMLVLETGSFACVWGLLRITVPGLSWRVAICSHLTGHAVGRLLPGGGALGNACQFRMLTVAGLDAATAGSALTVVSLLTTGLVFALPVFAVPAILLGHVPAGLSAAALYGTLVFLALAVSGLLLAFANWPPRMVGAVLDWVLARFSYRVPGGLAAVLLQRRNEIRSALGRRWQLATLAAAGKSGLDCLALMVALTATGQGPRPVLVLLAYVAATLLSMVPITPGGLGFVEAGLVGMLVVAGVPPGSAALATLAYRLVAYWLPMPVGLPAWFAFRRWHGVPGNRSDTATADPARTGQVG